MERDIMASIEVSDETLETLRLLLGGEHVYLEKLLWNISEDDSEEEISENEERFSKIQSATFELFGKYFYASKIPDEWQTDQEYLEYY